MSSDCETIASRLRVIDDDEPADDHFQRCIRLVGDLDSDIGERYRAATFARYVTASQPQAYAKAIVAEFAKEVQASGTCTRGLVLFGPAGTGKDHLAIAAGRAACWGGVPVRWLSGMDLFGAMRDTIGSNASEEALIAKWTVPQVLILSDPLPPVGSLTEFQAATMLRLVDHRYRAMRPTWVTINVKNGAEVDSRLGAQSADRLRDGALCVYCNWLSHRKPHQVPT